MIIYQRRFTIFKGTDVRVTCLAKTAMSSLKESDEHTSPPATPGSRGVHVASSHFSNTRASRGNRGWLREQPKPSFHTHSARLQLLKHRSTRSCEAVVLCGKKTFEFTKKERTKKNVIKRLNDKLSGFTFDASLSCKVKKGYKCNLNQSARASETNNNKKPQTTR